MKTAPWMAFLATTVLISGCSKFRMQTDAGWNRAAWLYPGGGLLHTGFRPEGPQPPLTQRQVLKLPAAPGEHLVALDSLLFVPVKNGRVYIYHAREKKFVGKLKYPVGVEGHVAVHPEGLLLMSLRLGHETLLCYDLKNARYLWKRRAGLIWGAPIPADSSVYVAAKFRHADRYDLRTGRRHWRYKMKGQAYAEPALTDAAMIFATDRGMVHAVDRRTGRALWTAQAGKRAIRVAPVVAARHGLVYIASLDSTLYALNLDDGREIWRYRAGGSLWKGPAVKDTLVTFSDGMGNLFALHARHGTLLWQKQFSTPFGTSPLVVNQVIYLGSMDKSLYALQLTTGEIIWKAELRGRVRTNPIVFLDMIAVGSEDRYVYLFAQEDVSADD